MLFRIKMGKFFTRNKSENRTITIERPRFMTLINQLVTRPIRSRRVSSPIIDNELSPIMETDAEDLDSPEPNPLPSSPNSEPDNVNTNILYPEILPPFDYLRNIASCPPIQTIPIQTQPPRTPRRQPTYTCTNCEQHCPTTSICNNCPIHCTEIPLETLLYSSPYPSDHIFNHSYPSTSFRSTPIPLSSFETNLSSDFEQIDLSPSEHLDNALLNALSVGPQPPNPFDIPNLSRNSKSSIDSIDQSTQTTSEHFLTTSNYEATPIPSSNLITQSVPINLDQIPHDQSTNLIESNIPLNTSQQSSSNKTGTQSSNTSNNPFDELI